MVQLNPFFICAFSILVLTSHVHAAITDSVDLVPVPRSDGKMKFRQTNRQQIVRRVEARQRATRAGALRPRQSAVTYPACSTASSTTAIPQSGFLELTGWYVSRVTPVNIAGGLGSVTSNLACIMMCEEDASCVGAFWSSTSQTCSFRQGVITAADITTSPGAGVMSLQGTCAELATQINNATIMASCCDNLPTSTATTCTVSDYEGHGDWAVLGQVVLNGNLAQSLSVTGTSNSNAYTNCLAACTALTTSGYASATGGCTGVTYDGYKMLNSAYNCYLYGGSLSTQTNTQNAYIVSFLSGGCNQATAGNLLTGVASTVCCNSG